MSLHRTNHTSPATRTDGSPVHRGVTAPARDVYGRTLDDAREADQQDYRVRKSRVDGMGRGQTNVLWFCCWLLAATIPISLLSPTWMPPWWPLVVIGVCAGVFGLVAVMRWIWILMVNWLGIEPTKPPDQTPICATYLELHASDWRKDDKDVVHKA